MKKIFNFLKQNIYLVTMIILLISIGAFFIGITYAYFDLKSVGESSSTMTIGGAEISATFASSASIDIAEAVPSDTPIGSKEFSLTTKNTSSKAVSIYINLRINNSTFVDTTNDGVLHFELLSGTDYGTKTVSMTMVSPISSGVQRIASVTIPAKSASTTTNYKFNLYFKPSSNKIQNASGVLSFDGNLEVSSQNITA